MCQVRLHLDSTKATTCRMSKLQEQKVGKIMGMYDHVRCKCDLPDGIPAGLDYQTKDLDCSFNSYFITKEGRITSTDDASHFIDFTGTLNIYWSNIVASGPGIYTRDGEDAHRIELKCIFIHGLLDRIDVVQNEKEPAAKLKPYVYTPLSAEQKEFIERRISESLLGRTLCVLFGGSYAKPFMAKVVAESQKELVLQYDCGEFTTLDRRDRGILFFDTLEDAMRHREDRTNEWQRKADEYEAEIKNKTKGR